MKTIKAISSLLLVAGIILVSACSKKSAGVVSGGATISGVVSYNNAGTVTPAPNALVWLSVGSTAVSTTQNLRTFTDANGNYSFPALNVGSYYVGAQYTDAHGFLYNSGGAGVTINDTKTVTANITLQ